MDQFNLNLKIIRHLRDYFIFSPSDLGKLLAHYNINLDVDNNFQHDSIFDFFKWKYDNFLFVHKYNLTFFSIGCNCLPHTLSIWNGFKLPNYLSNTSRLFFDLCITNIYKLLPVIENFSSDSKSIFLCDKVTKDLFFGSEKYNCLYNHDLYNSQTNLVENFNNFNNLLLQRMSNFINGVINSKNPVIIYYCEKKYLLDQLPDIFSVLTQLNGRIKLICVNNSGSMFNSPNNQLFVINNKFPSNNYVWYNDRDSISVEGFKYERFIFNKVKKYIIDNYPPPPLPSMENANIDYSSLYVTEINSKFYSQLLLMFSILNNDLELFIKVFNMENFEISQHLYSAIKSSNVSIPMSMFLKNFSK